MELGQDDDGDSIFRLNWTAKAGIDSYVALGFQADESLLGPEFERLFQLNESELRKLMESVVEQFDLEEYLNNTSVHEEYFRTHGNKTHPIIPIPIDGTPIPMELVYYGSNETIRFINSGTSQMFLVGLIPSDNDLVNMTFNGPVSSLNLVRESGLDQYLEGHPMMEALNMEEITSFTEVDGFIALEYFSMWPLMLLIFMAIKTGGAVSKHVDDQSIDILLATGYSRVRFLNEKMLVVLVNLILVVCAAWIGVVLGVLVIGKPVPFTGIAISFIGSLPMALGMIGLALLLSVLIDENSKTTGAIMGLTIFMFMIQIVANIAGWEDGLGYISLFTYYDMYELMIKHTFDLVNVIVPSSVGVLSIAGSYILFRRKEIHT
jgi:ABC-2 type transport system permease protein